MITSVLIFTLCIVTTLSSTWRTVPANEALKQDQTSDVHSAPQKQKVGIIRDPYDCLYAHKVIRDIHGEANFVWNEELAYDAEDWAINLAANVGTIQHSSFTFANGSRYGENLYLLSGGDPAGCHQSVSAWYKEIHGYDFEHPNDTYSHGHFTQLVWNETIQVGVGIAYKKETSQTFIVARYTPPGNAEFDEYVNEVFAPRPGTHIPTTKELLPEQPQTPSVVNVGVEPEPSSDGEKPCVDTVDCGYYVRQGDCDNPIYKAYMDEACYKSCGRCTPGNPIDGGWTNWHQVTTCSATCGGGFILSYRFCTKPFPQYGGKYCEGDSTKQSDCNTQECPLSQQSGLCVDSNISCVQYKTLGYCFAGKYSHWMSLNCRQSCDMC